MTKKINSVRWISALLAAFLCCAGISPAQTRGDEKEKKVDELFSPYKTKDSPGAAVVVVQDGKIILQKEYGLADLESGLPIRASTVFPVGSVSKQFTGYAILLLEQQGRLKLTDDIRKYLPELPEFMSRMTIRHILNHTSGLREQENLFAMCGITTADVFGNADSMEFLKRQKEWNFPPGDEIEYCNSGFILAAEIIARITGKSMREWTFENIFKPIGMNDTCFNDDGSRIIKNMAQSYFLPPGTNELAKGILSSSNVGSTGVITTSTDMAKWLIHFGDPRVGGAAVMNKMLTDTCTTSQGELVDYSYGIAVTKNNGLKANFHSGSEAGYRAFDVFYPEYKFGVAVLSNFLKINAQDLGFKIAKIFLENQMEPPAVMKNQRQDPTDPQAESGKKYVLLGKDFGQYAGSYFSDELETQYVIVLRNDSLVMKHIRNAEIILTPDSLDHFTGEYPMVSLHFIRDAENRIAGFRVSSARVRNLLFNKK